MALALSLPGMMGNSPSPSPSPSNLGGYAINPTPQRVAVQPANNNLSTYDVVQAIQQGLAKQGVVSVGGNPGNFYQKPSNITITQSASTTTSQVLLNQNTVYGAQSGTWTFSDGQSGKVIDNMITFYAGRLYLSTLSMEAQTSAAAQDGSALASAALTYTNYGVAGDIVGQIIVSNVINPVYFQAGSVIYDLTSTANPHGLPLLPTTKISWTPVSGDKYTFVLGTTIA